MAYPQVPLPAMGTVASLPAASIPDQSQQIFGMGKMGELYVNELNGRHYVANLRGRIFHGTTAAAGVLIPVQSATTITNVLWNPAGSGVNLVPIAAYFGWVSTTGAPANIGYCFQSGVGSTIGTAAPILTFTNVAPQSGMLGGGTVSAAKWAPATCTITTASTYLGTNGMSQLTTTGATTSAPWFELVDVFDGTIIITPGTIFHPTSANTAELSVFDVRMVWAEIPV